MTAKTLPDLLNEYAEALRGDWGDIDGRSERDSLNELADLIREKGNRHLTADETTHTRNILDTCPDGNGHWTFHCPTHDCASEDE